MQEAFGSGVTPIWSEQRKCRKLGCGEFIIGDETKNKYFSGVVMGQDSRISNLVLVLRGQIKSLRFLSGEMLIEFSDPYSGREL